MSWVFAEMIETAKWTPRLYFAPLVGAIRGMRAEMRQVAAAEKAARDIRWARYAAMRKSRALGCDLKPV
jgi:hypothetical protein